MSAANTPEPEQARGWNGARHDVEFLSGEDLCRAWLYLPQSDSPAPVIVMGHGLGGTRDMRLDAFAERFCDAGYACLVFDYRHFGASEGTPRQLLDIDLQLEDWAAAVAYARTLDSVDMGRVVLWGTSFGGGHVLVTAARDGGTAAVISQCPFTDGMASVRAMPMSTTMQLGKLALQDALNARLGRKPVMAPLTGNPGDVALMTAPDAVEGYERLKSHKDKASSEVAARIALQIGLHSPGKYAAKIESPALFCVCNHDSVAPAKETLDYAKKAPNGEIKIYDAGHFDIYVGDDFERVVADQIDFLHRQVPVQG